MKLYLVILILISFTGCYNKVYYNTLSEAKQAFPESEGIRIKTITDPHHQYFNRVEVRYKPF